MDSLTAHYLARELDARWRDRRVSAFALDRARAGVVLGAAGAIAVRVDLAARDASVLAEPSPPGAGALDGWIVRGVSAPEDDRRIVVALERPGKFRGSRARAATLEVSMVPSARGAALVAEGGHRLGAIGSALPPPAAPRPALDAGEVARLAAAGDAGALMPARWMCPWLAQWLVAHADEAAARYAAICALPDAEPARCGARILPFPLCDAPERVESLVPDARREDGSAEARRAAPADDARERALARMRRELDRAADAGRLRRAADALMALGDEAPAPAEIAVEGGAPVAVEPRQGESAVAAAERIYREVRSMERARESLPARIAALERALRAGGAADAARGAPERAAGAEAPRAGRAADGAAAGRLPYRSYRSSGGLEIRVGRGAAANDELTFRASSPDDVWLHARDTGGAHVVLRWQRDEAPPARDLEEAAILAAWHSRSRGSTLVPVDWTRRRYVRKPRGAKPGSVIVTRAATVLVRPSAAEERRLRDEERR